MIVFSRHIPTVFYHVWPLYDAVEVTYVEWHLPKLKNAFKSDLRHVHLQNNDFNTSAGIVQAIFLTDVDHRDVGVRGGKAFPC